MSQIGRKDLTLLLIGVGEGDELAGEIGGITRLQKLLFLLEQEAGLTPSGDGFEFAAYKAGPYSSRLYDDLEFLENLGFLRSEITGRATEEEAAEVDLLSFDELMGDDGEAPDAFEERRFALTSVGRSRIQELIESGEYAPVIDGIRKIKSAYGSHSLNDLLYHVYTKYPDMTTESEIKDKVLKRWSAR
jgi:uncharacterized protein YwgA